MLKLAGRLYRRSVTRPATDDTADPNAPRSQGHYRSTEEEAGGNTESHHFRGQQGAQICQRVCQGGDRSDSGYACKVRRSYYMRSTACSRDYRSGAWKTVHLKPYNFKAKGALTPSGALHPRKF